MTTLVLRLKGSDGVPPSRVGGRRAFAPGPSPALARRKTPHFAGPRPQSAARSEVVCLLRLLLARAFGGELGALPPPALRTGQRRRLPLALLTTDLLPCPALRAGSLCSKVSRGAACCQYNCSSRLSGEPVSPLPQYTTLLWSLRALDYCRTFRQLFEAVKKTVSNQG